MPWHMEVLDKYTVKALNDCLSSTLSNTEMTHMHKVVLQNRMALGVVFFFFLRENMSGEEGQRKRERENLKQTPCPALRPLQPGSYYPGIMT